jgi:uncharacterized protein involved in exopolysaccharide biosynthesis
MNLEDKEITIDFSALWKILAEEKWKIIISSIFCAIFAAIFVFNKPNEYTSTSSIMPELETSSMGGISKYAGLASLAGINLNEMSASDALRPDLYPNIINNTSFFVFLLDQPVKSSEGKVLKFYDFYLGKYEIKDENLSKKKGIISIIKNWLGIDNNQVKVNLEEQNEVIFIPEQKGEIIEELKEKITANMDKKSGIINIIVELPDPIISATVAQLTTNYLTDFVSNYRTDKARKDVEFLANRLSEAKGKYYSTQAKKAQYSDQFAASTMRLQSADIQRERIESDYRVNSSFYQELLKQYETAMLKVQEETPVFKILQKPIVPYKKSGPKRLTILFSFAVLGTFIGVLITILRNNNFSKILIYNKV